MDVNVSLVYNYDNTYDHLNYQETLDNDPTFKKTLTHLSYKSEQ